MPLTLVIGPANSAKAGEVLGAYGAAVPRGACLVVPTGEDALHYRAELAATGVVFGSVLTFAGLSRVIAARTGYAGRAVSARQREALLERAIEAARLEALAASARGPGFRRATGAMIAELQRNLVTPARFVSALRSWAGQIGERAPLAEELGRLYRLYRRELERIGRVDSELYAWEALDALRAGPAAWGREQLYLYGFDDLTPLERDAIETIARIAGAEVTVSLTYEAGRAAMAARARIVEELRPLADEIRELPPRDDYYAPDARATLHRLERELFEASPGEPEAAEPPGPAVRLHEAGGARAEAELIAARILQLLADGVRAEEIAVVYRSLERSGSTARQVLNEYGVAVAGRSAQRFAASALGAALTALMRCALADPEHAGAADLLAYLRGPGALGHPERADALEARLAQSGERSLGAARAALGRELGELDELRSAPRPGPVLCRIGRRLLAAPRHGEAAQLDAEAAADAAALGALEQALSELDELGRDPGPLELLALLEELGVTRSERPAPGEVVLAEPLEIRARRFRVVVVAGLQEGAFPRPGVVDPFLPEERRRELAAASGLALPPPPDALEQERYLFYATVSRATDELVLSYCSSDEEGNLALPSPFLGDVRALFGERWWGHREQRLLADVVWAEGLAPTEREGRRAARAAGAPAAGPSGPAPRRLGGEALARMRHSEVLSAGALEAYGDCPVRWLVERELRPQVLEPESEAITRGNMMHATLERLMAELGGRVEPGTLTRAEAILARLVSELAPGVGRRLGAGRPPLVRAGLLRAIEADLRRYLGHEAAAGGDWRPFGLELRFGFDDGDPSLPPLELGHAGETVRVRGMIDRVDVAGDGSGHAVVRDYKSGTPRSDFPVARWAVDRRLQVALYLLVVRELTELVPVAGLYQPLRGDDLRGRGMVRQGTDLGPAANPRDVRGAAEFEAELAGAAERAVELAGALRRGELTPCPATCSRDGCAFPAICRSQ